MKTVWIHYEDLDNSCADEDCCGGPSPEPSVKIFSSLEKAHKAGYKTSQVKEIQIDRNEFERLHSYY